MKADARMLLGWACDVAKGARYYTENFSCPDVCGGSDHFACACLGLIGFCLEAVDIHFCALDELHEVPKRMNELEFDIQYQEKTNEGK